MRGNVAMWAANALFYRLFLFANHVATVGKVANSITASPIQGRAAVVAEANAHAGLTADANVMQKTGKIHFVADLAREYGFTDVDGKYIPRFNPFV